MNFLKMLSHAHGQQWTNEIVHAALNRLESITTIAILSGVHLSTKVLGHFAQIKGQTYGPACYAGVKGGIMQVFSQRRRWSTAAIPSIYCGLAKAKIATAPGKRVFSKKPSVIVG